MGSERRSFLGALSGIGIFLGMGDFAGANKKAALSCGPNSEQSAKAISAIGLHKVLDGMLGTVGSPDNVSAIWVCRCDSHAPQVWVRSGPCPDRGFLPAGHKMIVNDPLANLLFVCGFHEADKNGKSDIDIVAS